MQFVYQGFTHDGDNRSFTFQGIQQSKTPITPALYSIQINLPLFAQFHVNMQEAPMFCLQLLTNALGSGPEVLEKFHRYRVVEEDLRPILADREKRAAIKALKPAPRRFIRKPPNTSQLRGLGVPEHG